MWFGQGQPDVLTPPVDDFPHVCSWGWDGVDMGRHSAYLARFLFLFFFIFLSFVLSWQNNKRSLNFLSHEPLCFKKTLSGSGATPWDSVPLLLSQVNSHTEQALFL